jgi:hypothetical protein
MDILGWNKAEIETIEDEAYRARVKDMITQSLK